MKKNKYRCFDCGKEIRVKNGKTDDGLVLEYKKINGEKIKILKCNDCYLKNKRLENYQPCEVYSRVVGYLRPVQQWNEGKKVEFKDRKEYIYER